MRRKDREVSDFNEILKIIDGCQVLRLGLSDGDCPYIVPVNFAYTVDGRNICFYIHGATAGRKYELLKRCGKCSFEMDIPLKIETSPEKGSVTMRYKSVMGEAIAEFLEGEEKRRAVDEILMSRYKETRNFNYNKSSLPDTAVVKLKVTSLSAKANA